jgi:hypothetical protein
MGGTGYALTQAPAAPQASHSSAAATKAPVWHPITLDSGWVYGGFNSNHPGYYKDSAGIVHLRGSSVGGSTATAAFQLPVGFRPSHVLWLSIYASNGSSGGLEIKTNGLAFLFDSTGGTDVQGWSSLDGISFPVP